MKRSIAGLLAVALVAAASGTVAVAAEGAAVSAPQFKVDYNWPKRPLPNKWEIGRAHV